MAPGLEACAHLRCIFIQTQPVILSFSRVFIFLPLHYFLVVQAVSAAVCERREALMNINGERRAPPGPVAEPCVSADAIQMRAEIS